MNEEVTVTVKVTLTEAQGKFLRSVMNTTPAAIVQEALDIALSRQFDDAEIRYDVSAVDSEPESVPERPAREFGDRGVVVTSEPRQRASQPRAGGMSGNARKSADAPKPMGRPATLWDHKCSDGGPVRERGERSVESLVSAGKEVYLLDSNGEVAETFGSKERKPVKKSAAPVSKGFKPTVVSKRRGQ
jgi:hypothetical protein